MRSPPTQLPHLAANRKSNCKVPLSLLKSSCWSQVELMIPAKQWIRLFLPCKATKTIKINWIGVFRSATIVFYCIYSKKKNENFNVSFTIYLFFYTPWNQQKSQLMLVLPNILFAIQFQETHARSLLILRKSPPPPNKRWKTVALELVDCACISCIKKGSKHKRKRARQG